MGAVISDKSAINSKNGATNLFFPLNDKIGVKASLSERVRDENHDTQEKASYYGLGPLVYGKVEFNYLGEKFYGYLTEIVETFNTIDETMVFEEFYEKKIDLKVQLQMEIGFYFTDAHYGNIGIKNGELVCIDFDSEETLYAIDQSFASLVENKSVVV